MSNFPIDDSYPVFWCCTRSGVSATGRFPTALVFQENSGSPIFTGELVPVNEFTGVYRTSIPILGLLGYKTGESYSIWATGVVSGGLPVRECIHRINIYQSLFNGITGIATNIYHAQIDHCYVRPSGLDRWTVLWYKNGAPYSVWSTGRLNVYNYTGGLHFGNSGLTAYGSNVSGGQLTVGGTRILNSGERYLAQTTAFIDGTTRLWQEYVGYDS